MIPSFVSPTSLQLRPRMQSPNPSKRQFRILSLVIPTSLQLRPHQAPPDWRWWRRWSSWRRREINRSRGSQGWPSWPTAGSLLWTTGTRRVSSWTPIYRGSGLPINSNPLHVTWPATGIVSWQWHSGRFKKWWLYLPSCSYMILCYIFRLFKSSSISFVCLWDFSIYKVLLLFIYLVNENKSSNSTTQGSFNLCKFQQSSINVILKYTITGNNYMSFYIKCITHADMYIPGRYDFWNNLLFLMK